MVRPRNLKTTAEIVAKIYEKFPEYDCSETVYIHNKLPITVHCPTHGYFTRNVDKGFECKECSLERRIKAQTMTVEEFISRAIVVHGDKYDYSLVDYKTARIKVKIICKTHNVVFEQAPHVHLKGKGCKLCANDKQAAHRKADNEHFIKRSVAYHGPELFTYEKLDYKNAKTPVIVTCKIHGDFPTYPDNHWLGAGCPDCSESGFSCNRPGILYVMHCAADSITKIGITNTQPEKRNKALNKSYGKDFVTLKLYHHDNGLLISQLETTMIQELRKLYKQPTTKFLGYSESFFDVDLASLLNSVEQKLGVVNGKKEESLGAGIRETEACPA